MLHANILVFVNKIRSTFILLRIEYSIFTKVTNKEPHMNWNQNLCNNRTDIIKAPHVHRILILVIVQVSTEYAFSETSETSESYPTPPQQTHSPSHSKHIPRCGHDSSYCCSRSSVRRNIA